MFRQSGGIFSISVWKCSDRVGVFFLLVFGTVQTEWGYFFYQCLEVFRQTEGICSISVWNCSERVGVFFLLVFGTVPTEWGYFYY